MKEKFVEVKTSELVGPALDWAVAEADGLRPYPHKGGFWVLDGKANAPLPKFSTNWAQGGPLWDERATSMEYYDGWLVAVVGGDARGPTKLIALCRAIVAAKLGDVVPVPVELAPSVDITQANDNEPTISPMAAITDELTWLVRETQGEWFAKCTHIARDGADDYAWTGPASMPSMNRLAKYRWFTKSQYLERKAELQNKPNVNDIPEWANFLIQTMEGWWLWLSDKPKDMDDRGVMYFRCDAKSEKSSKGEVIGDWRDTLEQRTNFLADKTQGAVE